MHRWQERIAATSRKTVGRRRWLRGACEVLLVVALGGCSGRSSSASSSSSSSSARDIPAAHKDDVAAAVRASNQFACDLYAKLAVGGGNVFLSPFSVSTALAMVDAGAGGTTDQELRSAMHVGLPGPRLHAAYGAMLASLDAGRASGSYTLAIANRLFGQTGFPFLPEFQSTMQRDYRAELMPLDFGSPENARRTVNAWVADHTEQRLTELLAPGSLDASTRLVLANAILFKGTWQHQFSRDATRSGPFRLADGGTVQAAMMYKRDTVAIAAIPGGMIGVLPFRGDDLTMVVLVPERPGGLPEVERQLSGEAIGQWLTGAHASEDIEVMVPRFVLTSAFELPDVLASLGIASAFDPGRADFSALDGRRDLTLQRAVHQARITVNEEGAEAVAATVMTTRVTSVPPSLFLDRPFAFFIHDRVTGAILFMGRLADPTRAGATDA